MGFHDNLITLMESLGYPVHDGLCHGFTMRWIEAVLSQKNIVFSDHIEQIMAHPDLKQSMEIIQRKKGKDLTPEEQDVLELMACLDSIALYESSFSFVDAFNPKDHLWDGNIEVISSLASSEPIKIQGGLIKVHSESMLCDREEITTYLEFLAHTFDQFSAASSSTLTKNKPFGILLSSEDHSIALAFYPGLGWALMDINQYPPDVYSEEDILPLSDSIIHAFRGDSDVSYMAFHASVILTNHDERLHLFNDSGTSILKEKLGQFKKLKPLCQKKPEDYIALAYITAQQGDADTMNQLGQMGTPLNEILVNHETPAHAAACLGHFGVLQALAKFKVDFNQMDIKNMTPLMAAAERNQASLVKFFHDQHVNLNHADQEGRTASYIAATLNHVQFIHELAEHGANLSQPSLDGTTPLMEAVIQGNLAAVIELLKYVKPDEIKPDGATAAIYAAMRGRLDILAALAAAGAKLNQVSPNGLTPAIVAAQKNQIDVLVELATTYHINLSDPLPNGTTIASIAANEGLDHVIQALAKLGVDFSSMLFNRTSLACLAAAKGHVTTLRALGECGINLSQANAAGAAAAHYAAQSNDIKMLEALVEFQAPLNPRMLDGTTPAYIAAERGHLSFLIELSKHGVNDFNQGRAGLTPLYAAARGGFFPCVVELLKHGVDPTLPVTLTKQTLEQQLSHGDIHIKARMNLFIQKQLAKGQTENALFVLPSDIAFMMGHKGIALFLQAIEREMATSEYIGPQAH